MQSETPLWTGSPSHIVNLGRNILCVLLCWLVVPVFLMIWWYLEVRCTKYELTSQRLRLRTGVLNRKTEDLELYRVRDYRIEQPLFLRLFGLANIVLETSDRTHPTVTLRAVRDSESLTNTIRARVEQLRAARGVREFDSH